MTEVELNADNQYPQLGGWSILSYDEAEGSTDDLQPTDVVIYYDFDTSDLSPDEEVKFMDWLYGKIDDIHINMSNTHTLIDEVDGSGNRLHYCVIVYRPI
jgi:hypothetical protein